MELKTGIGLYKPKDNQSRMHFEFFYDQIKDRVILMVGGPTGSEKQYKKEISDHVRMLIAEHPERFRTLDIPPTELQQIYNNTQEKELYYALKSYLNTRKQSSL